MNELVLNAEANVVIQFLHANAYTPGCYRQLGTHLRDYKIILPEQRPLWPNESPSDFKSWNVLAQDVIRHMDAKERKNVIGIGHSMGGVALWIASISRPDLFRQLILIDPVILPRYATRMIRWTPMSLKTKFYPIIRIASRRRDQWKDRRAAREYFLSKKIFQRFDHKTLTDFINFGLRDNQGGVTLAYPRNWEARIYATPPNLWPLMNKSTCPIAIIKAEHSDVITPERWKTIKKSVNNGIFAEIPGAGHLVPFEQPEECARMIDQVLSKGTA